MHCCIYECPRDAGAFGWSGVGGADPSAPQTLCQDWRQGGSPYIQHRSASELKAVDNIGYWERVWQEETVYEIGWGVLPTFQGRGIASAATAEAVASARTEQKIRV